MCRSKYGETVLVKSHCSILLVLSVLVLVLGVDASPVMVAVFLCFLAFCVSPLRSLSAISYQVHCWFVCHLLHCSRVQ